MDLDGLGSFVSAVGIPAAFAFGLLFIGWRVAKGLMPHAVAIMTKHSTLIDAITEAQPVQNALHQRQVDLQGDTVRILDELREQHNATDAPFSTVHTNEALGHCAETLGAMADDDKAAAKLHANQMKKAVE